MRAAHVWLVAALASCGGPSRSQQLDAALGSSERRVRDNQASYDLSQQDVRFIRWMTSDLVSRARSAETQFEHAKAAYQDAAHRYAAASVEYESAARDYASAEKEYRALAYVMMAAAASSLVPRAVCADGVSTAQYRRRLESQGIDLDGKDIDHIIPRSKGGPDAPWNYNPLPSSINRSLGNEGMLWKLQNYPTATIRALAGYAVYVLTCQ